VLRTAAEKRMYAIFQEAPESMQRTCPALKRDFDSGTVMVDLLFYEDEGSITKTSDVLFRRSV
jgi:hypothetical protein